MAKPSKLPEWDKNETDTTEPTTSRKDDGWVVTASVPEKPPYQMFNWWQNNVYKWINWIKDKVSNNVIIITTQAEFDVVFDGVTVLENRVIYLEEKGSTYTLGVVVPFGGNLKIDSDPGVTITRTNVAGVFLSEGTVGTPITNIHFTSNWIFEGVKGTYTVTGSGGFADIQYVKDSIFECYVNNCRCSVSGGGYADSVGNTNINCVISNVSGCTAAYGGGVSNCDNSIITNVSGCTATTQSGGGVYGCDNSIIRNINNNTASSSSGGGVSFCVGSTITNINNNTSSSSGGGVSECTGCNIDNVNNNTGAYGGGASDCDYSDISNVYDNTATTQSGGGLWGCDNSTISNVNNNEATSSSGGGVSFCINSIISNIYSNIASTNGGGVSECNNSTISNVNNNTATAGNGGGVYNCDNCTVDNIYDNTALLKGGGLSECDYCTVTNVHENSVTADPSYGGGLSECDHCTVTNVQSNTALTNGGGASICNECVFLGNWSLNTSVVNNNHIYNSARGLSFAIEGSGANEKVVTTRATINWT